MPLEDFIITAFCWIAANLRELIWDQRLRQRGFAPKLADNEVITMEALPLCVLTRTLRCRSFAGDANYCYCAAKSQQGPHPGTLLDGGLHTRRVLPAAGHATTEDLPELMFGYFELRFGFRVGIIAALD